MDWQITLVSLTVRGAAKRLLSLEAHGHGVRGVFLQERRDAGEIGPKTRLGAAFVELVARDSRPGVFDLGRSQSSFGEGQNPIRPGRLECGLALQARGREVRRCCDLSCDLRCAQERVEQQPNGLVRLTLKKKAYADGTVAVDMDPLSRLCRLATSVPLPRFHSVHYARGTRRSERVAFAA